MIWSSCFLISQHSFSFTPRHSWLKPQESGPTVPAASRTLFHPWIDFLVSFRMSLKVLAAGTSRRIRRERKRPSTPVPRRLSRSVQRRGRENSWINTDSWFRMFVTWHGIHVRRKYPKCTVFAATSAHPRGFESLDDAFCWPTVMIDKLSNHFGKEWMCSRLSAWRWNLSTAFSGIGAPESVTSPIFCELDLPFTWPRIVKRLAKALASLQAAADNFLQANGQAKRNASDPYICSEYACEVDRKCQGVLGRTYRCCVFQDILTFNPLTKTQYCTTHGKQCRVRKNHLKDHDKRDSASR